MEDVAQWIRESRFGKVDDILQYVVTERILHQGKSIGRDLANKLGFLMARGVINTALQDAASMPVSSDDYTIVANRVEDKL